MAFSIGHFDPRQRARAKEAERARDDRALAAGQISVEELRHRNSFAKGVDFSRAKIKSHSAALAHLFVKA